MKQLYIIIYFIFVFFVFTLNMSAQTMVTLETNREVKITVPYGFDILPKMEDEDEGAYNQWLHYRLEAWRAEKLNFLQVYTIVLKMPKEHKELNEDIKNVNTTDTFVFPQLINWTFVSQEHAKWYQWSREWSKKLYRDPATGLYIVTFVFQTATHLVIFKYSMMDLDDLDEFNKIIQSIEINTKFMDGFDIFFSNHEFWATMFLCIFGFLIYGIGYFVYGLFILLFGNKRIKMK